MGCRNSILGSRTCSRGAVVVVVSEERELAFGASKRELSTVGASVSQFDAKKWIPGRALLFRSRVYNLNFNPI